MTTQAVSTAGAKAEVRVSWAAMGIIALAQILLSFNISALPVSIGAIVDEFNTSPSSVSTALVVYSLFVAGFVMLGAKLGKLFGSRLMFQVGTVAFAVAMGAMALSTTPTRMIQAQGVAGLAAAVMVPALVVMIASHYRGAQQAQALGLLGAAQASAGVLAFLIAGFLEAFVSWRYAFGLLIFVAAVLFLLSFQLNQVARQPGLKIDWNGAILAAASIISISFGFNNLNSWGVLLARPDAPFDVLGLSPAPMLIVVGVLLGQFFFTWSRLRAEQQQPTLLALEVLDSPQERAATYSLFVIAALGPAVNFLIPLYMQIVQGRNSLQTAVAVIPYSLAIFAGTALIVRLFGRMTPRRIARIGFIVVTVGLTLLAFSIRNDWGTPLVILSLVVIGLGEGSLLTLVFNVLVSSSPKELAGDVGALRGTTNNLATGVGTAVAGALAVGVLSVLVVSLVANSTVIPAALVQQFNLDNVDFVSNEQLDDVLATTNATPAQVAEAVLINEAARLRALKASFLVLAGVALLAIIPAGGLPDYRPGEIPSEGDQVAAPGAPEGNEAEPSEHAAPAAQQEPA